MSEPEVIVVGAGPAGSVAALVLARAGVRVRLIERARFPRPKLCGDTINPGAMAVLGEVDPGGPLAGEVRRRALPVSGMTVTGPGGARVAAAYPADVRGASLERRELDGLLATAAIAAGAECDEGATALGPIVRDGTVTGLRLRCAGREQTLSARVVIAADGRGSRVGAALGLSRFASHPRRWAFGAYFGDIAGLSAHGEMHIRRDGYVGIAALPGGMANVCVVREIDARRSGPLRAPQVIADAVHADPWLRDRFAAARQAGDAATLGPLAVETSAAGCPGLLLAGDAAGFVDPMTGDGLRFALRGGVLAAEAALRELVSGRPSWPWLQAARAREFSGKWRINRALRTLAGSPRALSVAAAVATHWTQPVRYLVAVAGDVALATPAPGTGQGTDEAP